MGDCHLARRRNNKQDVELPPLLTAGSRLIPPTVMDWANGPPPTQWRLPIDKDLMSLVSRKRGPVIRSDSAIVAEFTSLDWDGPYRAVRFFLFDFLDRQTRLGFTFSTEKTDAKSS
jgi:hypothetical protein